MADAIEIFTSSASERIEVFTSGAQGPQGPAGPAGATFDQDLNTTDAVTFASVNAPLYDAALNQPGAGVDDAVLSIYGPDGTAKLDANGMTGLRVLTLPDESGTLALTANTATAAQGALADTAVQPNTFAELSGLDIVEDVPSLNIISNTGYGSSSQLQTDKIIFGEDPSMGGSSYAHILQRNTLSANATFTLPNATGTLALTSDIPTTFAASAITSGTLDNARINWAAPSAIGSTTAAAGTFTSLTVTDGTYTGALNADGANGVLAMRGAAQAFRVYNTYTSSTNYERGFMRWSSNVLQIGTEAGGTGSNREVQIRQNVSSNWGFSIFRDTTRIFGSFDNDLFFNSTSTFGWSSRLRLSSPADGRFLLRNDAATGFDLIQFGGTTSSFPALKRSSTVLQSRLADDSGFCPLQGQLRTHANAVSETITATHTLTLYDAAGTAYKVPCVAA